MPASGLGWQQFVGVNIRGSGPITILVPPGGAIPFNSFTAGGGTIPENSDPVFAPGLPFGTYTFRGPATFRINWQITVANSGQVGLQYSTNSAGPYIDVPSSVVGTSYGHCQIFGDTIMEFPSDVRYYVRLINIAANESNINFMPPGPAKITNFPSLTFQYLH